MGISIDEFNRDIFQRIHAEADADGQFVEDIFFQTFCEILTEAGELETADRADYRRPGGGIRVDGYGGDPIDSSGTLSLIITDFNQSGEIGRLTATEMNKIFQRLSKFLEKSLDQAWRNALEETSLAFGLADLIAQRWHMTNRVRLILISNQELSERVDGREADEFEGRSVTYSVWDIKRLHRFSTIGKGKEDIEIDLQREFNVTLPILPAHLSSEGDESYLAVFPGPVLAEIYDKWGARLLEQNVRVFLQARGNVNKGIKNTLQNDPAMFFAYNNGITATAEDVSTKEVDGQLVLTGLRNFQIVNGGQTTASIHTAFRNKTDLSTVFVQMKLSKVTPDRAEKVVPKISEYANSQNRVNAADFFANHPFHVRMEDFSRRIYAPSPDGTFRQTKWFYERARGQYNDARSPLTKSKRRQFDLENPRSQLVSKTDLAKFLFVWKGYPDKVSLGAQKNFAYFAKEIGKDWGKNDKNFNELFFKEAMSKAIIFRRTEKIVSSQTWYEGGYRANIVAYTISKIAHDIGKNKKSIDFERVWNTQSVSTEMEKTLAHVAKHVHDALVEPPTGIRNVTEWAKKPSCWERVKALDLSYTPAFQDELIGLEDIASRKQQGRKCQKVLDGIEAQATVFNAGGQFWRSAMDWGNSQHLLSERDLGMLRIAANIPAKIPTDRQSINCLGILERLEAEGFSTKMPC